jgi:molecular chaperone DnaK (HSP70)
LAYLIDISTIGYREIYTKHRRSYAKLRKAAANNNNVSSSASGTTPTSSINLVAARTQLEKDFKNAVQKQDQKIDLTKRMYDLVSRHIERIDSQMAKSDISELDWMGGATRKSLVTDDTSWKFDHHGGGRKRPSPHGALSVRKR